MCYLSLHVPNFMKHVFFLTFGLNPKQKDNFRFSGINKLVYESIVIYDFMLNVFQSCYENYKYIIEI